MKHILFTMVLLLSMVSTQAFADANANAGSLSGSQSQSGAIGMIDASVNTSTVEAPNLRDSAPGVFAAGVTAGGSNPCVVSVGGGLSVPGGGINFANAYNDGECNVRESLRLMAALSTSAEASNQVLLREISCQSVTYWDAFERVYDETGDARYFCHNERPEDKAGFIAARGTHQPRKQVTASIEKPTQQYGSLESGNEQDLWVSLGY